MQHDFFNAVGLLDNAGNYARLDELGACADNGENSLHKVSLLNQ
jgi:hypothetical protein